MPVPAWRGGPLRGGALSGGGARGPAATVSASMGAAGAPAVRADAAVWAACLGCRDIARFAGPCGWPADWHS
eukprot:11195934-Lingulodinium_polyedra.AAC.1